MSEIKIEIMSKQEELQQNYDQLQQKYDQLHQHHTRCSACWMRLGIGGSDFGHVPYEKTCYYGYAPGSNSQIALWAILPAYDTLDTWVAAVHGKEIWRGENFYEAIPKIISKLQEEEN